MKLINLTLKNFMPYKDTQKITFPRNQKQNVILIFGDNMRGKTSLLNALRWVFYGKAWGRQLRPIEQKNVVNWDAASMGSWETEINIQFKSNGNKYDLRRMMKPKELIATPKRDEDFEISVGLQKNGILITGDKIAHELNQIIPEQISRFFLFDGELLQEYEMLLIQKSDHGRQIKEAIEQILGVPALINGRNELRTLLKKARSNQAQETRRNEELKAYSAEQEKLTAELETLETDFKKLTNEEEDYKRRVSKLEDQLSETEGILKYKTQLDSLKEERKRRLSLDEKLRDEKLAVLACAWKDMLQPQLQTRIRELEKERNTYRSKIEKEGELKAKIKDLNDLLTKSKCPTCSQEIPEEIRNKIGTNLGTLEGELDLLSHESERIGEVTSEISRLSKIHSSGAKDIIQRIEKDLNETNVRLTKIESDIDDLSEKIKGHDTAEIFRKRAQKEQFLKELGKLSNKIQEVNDRIEANNKKQNHLSALISKDPASKRSKISMYVDLVSSLEEVFSEGIEILRDDLRSTVADLATSAFKNLITEETYLKLDINENYGLSIIDRHGRNVSERSAGAEQIVALALIDGLNKTARKTGPIVMDTPLGRLDPKHRKNLISYMPEMAEQVVMLVHEGEMSKSEIFDSLKERIGAIYEIERISSSESRIIKI